MKTTILTSFVAIALFAVRRSYAVVVGPQINLSDLVVPGLSLPQQNGVSYQAKRHLAATVQRDEGVDVISTDVDGLVSDLSDFALNLEPQLP